MTTRKTASRTKKKAASARAAARAIEKMKALAFIIMPFSAAKPLEKSYAPLKKDDLDTI